jgi:hypothetical protein
MAYWPKRVLAGTSVALYMGVLSGASFLCLIFQTLVAEHHISSGEDNLTSDWANSDSGSILCVSAVRRNQVSQRKDESKALASDSRSPA